MDNKEIVIVYQDCFMCGSKKPWGEKTIEGITKSGASYRKVSFASVEGQAHCAKAVLAGITSLPFITDGKTYASDIETLLQAESKPQTAKKTAKKTKKMKKEVENGTNSEL